MEGLKKLKEGNFNTMNQEEQPDGSVIIELTSRWWGGVERFRVKGLYSEEEVLLDVDTGEPIC